MYCPNCNKHFESAKFCPDCEGPNGGAIRLIDDPDSVLGPSFHLGDANAISGGINVNASKNIHNEDRSVHNITNITQVSMQKTDAELLQEQKTLFLNACKRAYEDNVLKPSEAMELEEFRIKIGLDRQVADSILESIRLISDRSVRKSTLNQITKTKLKIFTDNIRKNEVKTLIDQVDSLAPLVRQFDNDELVHKYYLVLSALKAQKCIEQKEVDKTDSYWESFWCYLAYIKVGRFNDAEEILAGLNYFTNYPEDNMIVLAAAGALMMGQEVVAKEYLNASTGTYSPMLQHFVDSLYFLLDPAKPKDIGANENTCAFYLINFFQSNTPKVNSMDERLRIKEEESQRKRKIAEAEAESILSDRKHKPVVPRTWIMAIGNVLPFNEIDNYWNTFCQPEFTGLHIEEPTTKKISKFCSPISNDKEFLILFHPQKKELLGVRKMNGVGMLYFISHELNTYCFRYAVNSEMLQILKEYFSSGIFSENMDSWQKKSFTDMLSK